MSRAQWAMAAVLAVFTALMGTKVCQRAAMPYVHPNDPAPGQPVRPRATPKIKPAPPVPAPAPAPPVIPAVPAAAAQASLVDVRSACPGVVIDLRYATADNFLRQAVYPVARPLLHERAAERLCRVQTRLAKEGFGLVLYDGYRPLSVQRAMWKLVPDPRYVADPRKGSRHNRGGAVDVGLVDAQGTPLPMPTAFDDFTPRAAARAPADEPARGHRERLRTAMLAEGFRPVATEWWHFDAPGADRLPVLDVPLDDPPAKEPAP
jgi:D-alanyl-D-alanine dipeptidase